MGESAAATTTKPVLKPGALHGLPHVTNPRPNAFSLPAQRVFPKL